MLRTESDHLYYTDCTDSSIVYLFVKALALTPCITNDRHSILVWLWVAGQNILRWDDCCKKLQTTVLLLDIHRT